MRRPPPSWALLVVAAALLAGAGTVFRTVEIDSGGAWVLLGAALVLIGEWSAIEIHQSLSRRKMDDGDGREEGAPRGSG